MKKKKKKKPRGADVESWDDFGHPNGKRESEIYEFSHFATTRHMKSHFMSPLVIFCISWIP